jgi:hypothetical protein
MFEGECIRYLRRERYLLHAFLLHHNQASHEFLQVFRLSSFLSSFPLVCLFPCNTHFVSVVEISWPGFCVHSTLPSQERDSSFNLVPISSNSHSIIGPHPHPLIIITTTTSQWPDLITVLLVRPSRSSACSKSSHSSAALEWLPISSRK